MGYEAATYINELVATNPVAADDREAQGYLHLQNIKAALKNTFPNASAPYTATHTALNAYDGLTVTAAELNKMDGVTATTAEINYLSGVTSSIQVQLDAAIANLTIESKTNVNWTGVAGHRYLGRRTQIPLITMTLPSSPSANDTIVLYNVSTGSPTGSIAVSGTINGSSSGVFVAIQNSALFRYVDETTGWLMVSG